MFLFACTPYPTGGFYQSITPEEALVMLEEETAILIDVRSENEYRYQRIEGAMLIPVDQIHELALQMIPDLTATYIVYCRTGNRSQNAVNILLQLGYEHVYDLGGILDWPYDTISDELD
jgi:rhodanese-related sulfurtransferase